MFLSLCVDTSTSIDKSVPLEMAIATPGKINMLLFTVYCYRFTIVTIAPKRHHDDAPDAIKKAKLEVLTN